MDIDMPWKPRSRQQEGMLTEKVIAKKRGARLHPRSGAGRIKDDASTEDEILEIKDANLSFTLKSSAVDAIFRRAARQGKAARFVVYFKSVDITADITLRKGKV